MTAPIVEHVPHLLCDAHRVQQTKREQAVLVEAHVAQGQPIGRHTPGDAARLRGIPVVGVDGGYGGAIKGTRPGTGL